MIKYNTLENIESYLLIGKKKSLLKTAFSYLNPGEQLLNVTKGGGESLVIFIKKPKIKGVVVRKIWDSKLLTIDWEDNKKITMIPPIRKGYLQIEYLNNLPKKIKSYFPQIFDFSTEFDYEGSLNKVICDQTYIHGLEVSRFVLLYKPAPYIVARLYTEILKCLKEVIHENKKTQVYTPTLEISYFSKIMDRLKVTQQAIPQVISSLIRNEYIVMNGVRYINIPTIINKFRKNKFAGILQPYYHNFVVGDTNTQNIKIVNVKYLLQKISNRETEFSYKKLGIKFLDPRSLGFNTTGKNTIDDYMYDNKPFHNSLGNYDMIYGKYFNLNISNVANMLSIDISERKNPYSYSYKGLEKYFKTILENSWKVNSSEFLKDDPYWLIRFVFLMGRHFSAMLPFQLERDIHGNFYDNYIAQKRVVAIYCEGVKWLNIAYKMLTGEIKEFNGFIIPEVETKNGIK